MKDYKVIIEIPLNKDEETFSMPADAYEIEVKEKASKIAYELSSRILTFWHYEEINIE